MNGSRPTISSMNGIVAAAHPHAAAAGARILGQGGTAFDAAVAVAAALNVVEPFMSSLAGQGLATCWIAAEKRVRTLDFVPRIPLKFPVERLSRRSELARGSLSVGVPGNLAGWAELMRAHGRLTFADVLAPAIALARDGFPVTEFNILENNATAPEIREHGSKGFELVFDALAHQRDAEVRGTVFHAARRAARDDGEHHAAPGEHLEPVAVERVEALQLATVVVEVQRAVGHHAIHVEHGDAHTARPFVDRLARHFSARPAARRALSPLGAANEESEGGRS